MQEDSEDSYYHSEKRAQMVYSFHTRSDAIILGKDGKCTLFYQRQIIAVSLSRHFRFRDEAERGAVDAISTRLMPCEVSMCSASKSEDIGRLNAGHPHPESYLSDETNRGCPVVISTYIPTLNSLSYSLVYGRSVAPCCVTAYCSAVNIRRNSLSDGFRYCAFDPGLSFPDCGPGSTASAASLISPGLIWQ